MTQEYYISLIIQQLSDQLDHDQESQLNEWLASSDANTTLKDNLVNSWNKANHYKNDISIDESKAWHSIKTKLPSPTKVIPIWRRPLSIAASVLLVFSCLWLFSPFSNEQAMDQAMSISTEKGQTKSVELPDGSKVNLNEESTIHYVLEDNERKVILDGEALFEVTHDAQSPFVVHTQHAKTTVLGTTFNVNARSAVTQVSLFEGKVAFDVANNETVVLAPGERAQFNASNGALQKDTITNENAIAWKTKSLVFKNDKLSEAIPILEAYFRKTIELNLLDNETCLFTGVFKDATYNEIIDVLKFTYDMNFESSEQGDKITINACQ